MNRLKQSLASLPSFSPSGDHATSPPLPEERLASLSSRRQVVVNLHATFSSFHKALAKQRPNPTVETRLGVSQGETDLPARWVGEAFLEGAEALQRADQPAEDMDRYQSALSTVGEAHVQLATLASSYHDALAVGYLDALERRLDDYKELEKHLKEAEKRRAALEGVMSKAEKGKKDRSEYEEELEQAGWMYSDECDALVRKADQLDSAVGKDVEALRELIDVQLDFASRYVSLLEECKAALLTSAPGYSRASSPARARSSSLHVPAVATRLSRSQSDSSVRAPPPTLVGSFLSPLGPGRARRSTVSSQTSDKDKEKEKEGKGEVKNRSRSGSMLERFAFGAGKKDKSKKKDKENGGGEVDADDQESDRELDEPRPSSSGTSTPSRFVPSGIGMPSLPTLGSLKKLTAPSASRYGSLPDADTPAPAAPTTFTSPRRLAAPALKRTQTAPPTSSPTTSSPHRPPLSPLSRSSDVVGQTFISKWAYNPSLADPDELELDKGDLVRVEKEVNADWWIGVTIEGRHEGSKGMFPSAYVVPYEPEPSLSEADHDDEQDELVPRAAQESPSERERGWTTFSDAEADSRRSSTSRGRSSSPHDDDDDRSALRQSASPGFTPGRVGEAATALPSATSASPAARPPPPIPAPRAATPKKTPPPPPPSRRAAGGSASGAASPFE
ncbi:hypothetical protein JCM5296_004506 [Sporobolomyces johnsonii]